MNKGIGTNTSNVILTGFGVDVNGNSIVKFKYPNSRGYSIQTNGNLPQTHRLKLGYGGRGFKSLPISGAETIIREIENYVQGYGTGKMKTGFRKKGY